MINKSIAPLLENVKQYLIFKIVSLAPILVLHV